MTEELTSIQAVVFDFGGVLCFHPGEDRFHSLAEFLEADPAAFKKAFWQHRVPYDAGLDAEEYWSTVVDDVGRNWDHSLLPELLRREVELWNHFDTRMMKFAAHLQSVGYSTAMLSNLPRSLGEALRATPGFLDCFDHLTFSYELGLVKPDLGIYRHVIDGLGVAPEQILFLDDREENIEGARRAGLQAELYTTWSDVPEAIAPRYGLPMPEVARRQ